MSDPSTIVPGRELGDGKIDAHPSEAAMFGALLKSARYAGHPAGASMFEPGFYGKDLIQPNYFNQHDELGRRSSGSPLVGFDFKLLTPDERRIASYALDPSAMSDRSKYHKTMMKQIEDDISGNLPKDKYDIMIDHVTKKRRGVQHGR
jgi:hypothetical protein